MQVFPEECKGKPKNIVVIFTLDEAQKLQMMCEEAIHYNPRKKTWKTIYNTMKERFFIW